MNLKWFEVALASVITITVAGCASGVPPWQQNIPLVSSQGKTRIEEPLAPVSLKNCVLLAIRHSPILSGLRRERDAKGFMAKQSGLWLNPTLYVQADEGEQIVKLTQPFDIAGKRRLNREVFNLEVKTQGFKILRERHDLIKWVSIAYFRLGYAIELREIAHKRMKLRRRDLLFARKRRELGAISSSDLLKNEQALLGEKIVYEGYSQAVGEARAQLNYLIGQNPKAKIKVMIPPDKLPNLSQTLEMAVENNPDIQMLEAQIYAQGGRWKRAKIEWAPDVSIGAYYRRDGNRHLGGIALNLPLPVWNSNRYGVRAEQAKLKALQDKLIAKRQQVLRDAYLAILRIQGVRKGIEISYKMARNFRKTVEILQKSILPGETSKLDVIQAKIKQLTAEEQLVTRKFACAVARAEFDRAFGIDGYRGGLK